MPVAAHNPGYAHLVLASPANGTPDISSDGAEHSEAPGYGQKDAEVRNQHKQ